MAKLDKTTPPANKGRAFLAAFIKGLKRGGREVILPFEEALEADNLWNGLKKVPGRHVQLCRQGFQGDILALLKKAKAREQDPSDLAYLLYIASIVPPVVLIKLIDLVFVVPDNLLNDKPTNRFARPNEQNLLETGRPDLTDKE